MCIRDRLNTLVPLGVVMIAYDLFLKNSQNGGGSSILGESIPPNVLQGVGSVLSGNTPSLLTSTNYSITDNALGAMQCSDGSCGANHHTSYIKESGVSPTIIVKDIVGSGSTPVNNTFSAKYNDCLLYTSPSPRDATLSRMPSSA